DGGNGADTLDATATGSATLGTGDFALTAGGIDFSNILAVTTATLNANAAGSSFVLNSDNTISANGITVSGATRVNGAGGNDSLNAQNLGNEFLYLRTADGRDVATQTSGGILFSAMDSVTASNLDFSQVPVDLTVSANNTLATGGATFNGVLRARGDGDNTVTGLGNWTLLGGGGASNSNI
ncbi:hypothetical protein ACNKU7_18800, partial [Microbulbifer sp. SA54]|uniref:hypothetical protein n=1 Tax=Microbulbifer sp. SA54 TaxID=3401577 RepID=UPI003AAFCFA4